MSDTYPQMRTVGLDGLLVTFAPALSDGANRAAIAFRSYVESLGWPELRESSSTLVSAFFSVDLVEHAPDGLMSRLSDALGQRNWLNTPIPEGRSRWTIPVCFEGQHAPDLEDAIALTGLDETSGRAAIETAQVRVLTLGFAPGQPYTGFLPDAWDIPRQTKLTQVPQGALVVAVRQLIIFTNASPTGWRQAGQTAFKCFRPDSSNPIALHPGDEIHLAPVSARELDRIIATDTSGNGGAERVTI